MGPLVGLLASKGLGMITGLFKSKGEEFATKWVKDKTGIDLSSGQVSDEDAQKLSLAQMDHEEELLELQLKITEVKLDYQKSADVQDTERMKNVNETMRVEITKGGWPGFWRPFWGVISAIAFLFVVIMTCVLAWKAVVKGDASAMQMIPQFVFAMTALFGVPMAILGIASWHRGKEKIELAKGGNS